MIIDDETNTTEIEARIQNNNMNSKPFFFFTKKNVPMLNGFEINSNIHNSLINIEDDSFIEEQNSDNNVNNCGDDKHKKIIHNRPFSIEEDNYLSYLVRIIGDDNWIDISEFMKQKNFNRSSRQCRDRYFHYLDPKINKSTNWTEEEDDLLVKCVQNEGKKWKKFENYFPGRTEVSLRNRYHLINRKQVKKIRKSREVKKNLDIMSNCFSFFDSYFNEMKSTAILQNNDHKNKSQKIKKDSKMTNTIQNDNFDIFKLDDDSIYDYNELFSFY